jgi:peroxiredoxin/uncharacterized membrane protein YphA (DoxX/SURF4 family)
MGAALLVCRLALASVFVTAGVAKLADPSGTRRAVADFGVPERFALTISKLLPAAELALAAALVPTATARAGAIAAAALLTLFTAAIAAAIVRGRTPDCHCFGQLHSAPAGRGALIRNACLLALAIFVAAGGAGDTATSAPLAATAAAVVLAGLAARRRDEPSAFGLPVGARAPDFELEDAAGNLRSLSSLLNGTTHLVLVFTDSSCTACHAMLPEIAWVQRRASDTTVAIVASGDPERNRADRVELMLLQREREVADAYRIPGTPMAVVIDARGRIERPPLAGPDAISDALAELSPAGPIDPAELGDPIPDLVLPDPHGRRVSLRELYRDPTIIVFWDPHCEFSRQMLPGLTAFEREATAGAPQLILITPNEGAPRITSTVLHDPDGRARATFGATGTPMAVLLSEDQVASPVAAGARTVFNLIDAATLAPR